MISEKARSLLISMYFQQLCFVYSCVVDSVSVFFEPQIQMEYGEESNTALFASKFVGPLKNWVKGTEQLQLQNCTT
jgi:hypothetical protein